MNALWKKVLIVGTGKSGIAAASLVAGCGGCAVLFDENETIDKEACRQQVLGKVKDKNSCGEIAVLTGLSNLTKEYLKDFTLAVLSPGVPTDQAVANLLRENDLPIWGEIEMAWSLEKGRVLAITGTNGKTTTTSLLGSIMKRAVKNVLVVGNIGTPYTEEVQKSDGDSCTVAEISSFQLETTHDFHPVVSAILNLTPDHLNRHHTMENYVRAKQDITKKQTKEDVCVLNADDPYTEAFLPQCPARVVLFSSSKELADGFFYKEGVIYRAQSGKAERLLAMDETRLLGVHNAENIMAAVAMADAAGVPMDTILAAVKVFTAVEHRIEFVSTVDGVDYYNDSKGTNPDAAIKAVNAMVKPTWLIGGGYDKDSTYDEWIESFGDKIRGLVLLGQTKEKIAACAKEHGFEPVFMTETFEEAVNLCREKAVSGEAVLLSPACASWGMFKNYEQRGEIFKELVHSFEGKE
ncbi:MAG: UDP-N-acetylmuramoyl-L-alanine--D-glutamate ligase [Lachnospiraceae bacterium]|nr:UDP-N-acetylmuramoyl-L-alanine--D-glutamate ligase [Lachnospiraceae bacterium]